MPESTATAADFAAASKRVARRLLTIGENRLELLRVEAQEERERLMVSIVLAIGVMGCGLLAAMTLTAAIVVISWRFRLAGRGSLGAGRHLWRLRRVSRAAARRSLARVSGLLSERRAIAKGSRMFGKSFGMRTLEARRKLLVAESDLNRAQLGEDLAAAKAGLNSFRARAQLASEIALSAAGVISGLAAFRRRRARDSAAKPSLIRTALETAGLISRIWLAIRAKEKAPGVKGCPGRIAQPEVLALRRLTAWAPRNEASARLRVTIKSGRTTALQGALRLRDAAVTPPARGVRHGLASPERSAILVTQGRRQVGATQVLTE